MPQGLVGIRGYMSSRLQNVADTELESFSLIRCYFATDTLSKRPDKTWFKTVAEVTTDAIHDAQPTNNLPQHTCHIFGNFW